MRKLSVLLAFLVLSACDFSKYRLVKDYDFETRYEKTKGKETATYAEVIQFYNDLEDAFGSIHLQEYGKTDSGKPLHLVIYNKKEDFDVEKRDANKTLILINNGIHPGESDGIDASMLLFRDLAQDSIQLPENVILASIPVYNIGGALNRNSFSRTNQNGPKEYGFRGNARNFDLNRDFIKADTKNTFAFYEIFHKLQPDYFLDNHVSNGADYPYTLTHLFTQHNKLGENLGAVLENKVRPQLEDSLQQQNWEIIPYVNVFNKPPEVGFAQFMDFPRYSTGYTALFQTPGMMLETHMLKPYAQRVEATYAFMEELIPIVHQSQKHFRKAKNKDRQALLKSGYYKYNYKVDSTQHEEIAFKAYQADTIKSTVTEANRLRYNRGETSEKYINYYNTYKAQDSVKIPDYYILPQAWWEVVNRLKANGIKMTALEKDTVIQVEQYRISDFKTRKNAYEGHYLHYDTQVEKRKKQMMFTEGDFKISTAQPGMQYILTVLEPQTPDSFFNWNFFDSVLQQKEHFSPYVFEDTAKQLLKENKALKKQFEKKKKENSDFENNWYAQLAWLHKQSKHYEKAHLRYPVYRLLER
ncbi:M14 family metallopeptidase [Haloflavibacter putidus]|uniref:Zinc carboxypeptidase n=1 Tax=Haloflavibacter putidus TaxID=2576776 RepID=A0A507ZLX2_9FLAO|nr:M14 family metallopeptidase [Haloflavibacter putidus]TQD38676.1 hypothetical protein FKR84_08495 [Haloflavibacter putidus]